MGGKNLMAKRLIPLFPEHKRYVEVFMGSAAIFFQKSKAKINILNDLNSNLTNLFNVMKYDFDKLKWWVDNTPISRELYDLYLYAMKNNWRKEKDEAETQCNPIDRAGMYLYLVRTSFNCQVGSGAFCMTGESKFQSWSNEWKSTLEKFHKILDSVVIENLDFEKLIKMYDTQDTFFYVDPPYFLSKGTNYYANLFKDADHIRLRDAMVSSKGKWMISYDETPVIRNLYKDFRIEVIDNHPLPSGNRSSNLSFKDEIIIMNYKQSQQESLF